MKQREAQQLRCIDCHFLHGYISPDETLSEKQRSSIRGRILDELPHDGLTGLGGVSCWRGLWKIEGAVEKIDKQRVYDTVLKTDRSATCPTLSWPYTPGMAFSTAAELCERAATEAAAAKDRELTRRSLCVAVIALVVSTVVNIATEIIDRVWPK